MTPGGHLIIPGNSTAPHSFSAFIELRWTVDMINFTAVMRSPGFCGGGVQTRNVNYCMAVVAWEHWPLSANQRPGMGPATNEETGIVHGKMGNEQSGLTGGNHESSAYT